MPRIRTIKPEFWTSAQILECSTNARLLFIGLWNFADDSGRHPDNAKQIKAEVFPADEFTLNDIQGMIQELSANDLIIRYVVDGKAFIAVRGWHHQRIDKPQSPKYPGPYEEYSKIVPGTLPPDRKGRERKGKERKGKEKEICRDVSQPASEVDTVFDHWRQVMGHEKAKLDEQRKRLIRQSLELGYSVEDLKEAIRGYSRSPFHTGANECGRRYDGLELILRNAEKIDAGIEFFRHPPKLKGKQSRIEAINRQETAAFLRGEDPFGGEVIEGEARREKS